MDNINTLPRIGKQNSKNAQILSIDLKCWKMTKILLPAEATNHKNHKQKENLSWHHGCNNKCPCKTQQWDECVAAAKVRKQSRTIAINFSISFIFWLIVVV